MNSKATLRRRPNHAWQSMGLLAVFAPAVLASANPNDPRFDGGKLGESQRRSDEAAQAARPVASRKTVIRAAMPRIATSLTSLRLSIREFRFEGLSQVSSDAIDEVLAPWKNRELNFPEFEQAVHAVANYLREHGHPNAEVKLSRALVGGGTVAVAIQGLAVPASNLALRPTGEDTVPRIDVKSFRVTGATLAGKEEIDGLLQPLAGKALTMQEIEQAAETVASHLRAKGYPLVQAYLPPQKIDGGEVEIAVQEGVMDGSIGRSGVKVVGGGERVKREIVEELLASGVKPGEPLRIVDLERAVLLANDTPGIKSVKTTLLPGSAPGTTHVEAKVEEAAVIAGTVWADNYGSRYTGIGRTNAQVNVNSPIGYGEQLSVNASKATGMSSGKVALQAPIGISGVKVGASMSEMKLKIGEEVAPLNLSSDTSVASVFANYALERSSSRNIWLSANYDSKHVENKLSGLRANDRQIGLLTLGASGDLIDPLGGQVGWGASYGFGSLDLSGNASYRSLDAVSAKTEGSFGKFNWNAQRMARVDDSWSWMVSASGLRGSKNLDSAEKFQLGGPTGVRAYPVGEGLGDAGWLGSAELRYSFGQTEYGEPQVFAFYDTGSITQYRNLWALALPVGNPNTYSLSGWGLGASLAVTERGSLRMMWAKKSGTNPNPTSTGTDSDGTSKSGRIWIVGNILF